MAEVQKAGRVDVLVHAPAEAVWRVIADVTRTGEWSHECREVHWLGGAVEASPGARFRGGNRAGWARWGRICEIVNVDAPREIAWQTVSTPLFPDSTVWRIRLESAEGGTRIVQEFEVVRAPKLLDHLYAAVIPAHRDRTARLTADLERIGMIAEQPPQASNAIPVRAAAPHPKRRLTRLGNRIGVWLYRQSDGRLASGRKGVTVLMLTVAGRRTGQPRSTCMRYLNLDDGWVVWGTGSGSRNDPDWFENLRAADVATVQIGSRVVTAIPREIVGAERDRIWSQVVLAQAPEVARYARKAGRPIPVATLTPVRA
jgi:deazaflavin-dependent oxidoreductase (nitroreductase family)